MADDKGAKSLEVLPPGAWEKIERAIRTVGYGSIMIVVQDARVVQIEINEKIKLC